MKSLSPVVPIKVGFFGDQGAGKITSAAMLAFALSKELHNGGLVWVTDTEPGWQFLRPMFAAGGVKLDERTVATFKAMLAENREAEPPGRRLRGRFVNAFRVLRSVRFPFAVSSTGEGECKPILS